MALGLPVGALRRQPSLGVDSAAIRSDVTSVTADPGLEPARAVPLLAWLAAWHHHWPARFAQVFGSDGPALLATLADRVDDDNRYLKLRRIAIANLARIL